jgi:hypothetical protein
MTKGKSIVVAEKADLAAYDVLSEGVEAIRDMISANVGGMTDLWEFNLTRAVNPSGGAKTPRWEIPGLGDEPEFVGELEGIIVFHKNARVYYERSYEESGGGQQPDCMSRDGIRGEGTPGGLCPKCPLAKFKKLEDGSTERPLCREVKRLFLLRPGEIMPTMFNATGGNVGQVQQYLLNLTTKGRLRFNHCITRLRLSAAKYKNGRDWSRWDLSMVSALPAEVCEQMDAFHDFLEPIVAGMAVTVDDVVEDSSEPSW